MTIEVHDNLLEPHVAELIEDFSAETERLKSIHVEMSTASIDDLHLDATEPSGEGVLGCEICCGTETCDYPRGGQQQPLHSGAGPFLPASSHTSARASSPILLGEH